MKVSRDSQVKNDIIDSAQKLFRQFGLKKTTMDEIATACGKAKSTLYHYYKSKEEVFDDVLNKEMLNLRIIVDSNVKGKKTLQDKLKIYFETFHNEAVNKFNFYRILKQEIKYEFINTNRFSDVIQFETKYVQNILLEGIASGEFTNAKEEDIGLYSEVIVVAFLGIVRYSVEKNGVLEIDNLRKVTDILIPRVFT